MDTGLIWAIQHACRPLPRAAAEPLTSQRCVSTSIVASILITMTTTAGKVAILYMYDFMPVSSRSLEESKLRADSSAHCRATGHHLAAWRSISAELLLKSTYMGDYLNDLSKNRGHICWPALYYFTANPPLGRCTTIPTNTLQLNLT